MSSTMRDAFVTSTEEVLADPRTTVVLADISDAHTDHPEGEVVA